MAKLFFKPNFLRNIFEIGTSKYENFDENIYRAATKSERAGMNYPASKAAQPFHLHWGGITMDPKPNDLTINRKRWGKRKHPEFKGAIYYRFQDALIKKKTVFSVGLFSEDSSFRKQYRGNPVIFFKGIQAPEKLWIDDIRVNQNAGHRNAEPTKVDIDSVPNVKRAFLLAHRSYEQISSETGITPEENLEWAESLSNDEAVNMFNDQFGEFIIEQ